jgi:hypothetical protein
MCDPSAVRISHLLIPLAALAFLSCKASVKADVNVGSKEDAKEEDNAFDEVPQAAEPQPILQTEYFGIARRLTLRPAQRAASCQCVTAVVGSGGDPNFEWYGEKPDIGPDALVVAVSAEGIACEHKGRGPSIAAIDREGQDVIVVLEEFKDTRPIALGAIVPNPGPTGSIYLRARGKAPYGRPEVGKGYRNLCKVGTGTASGTP